MCKNHKSHRKTTSLTLIVLAGLVCLCKPARATVNIYNGTTPNWLGEIVWEAELDSWHCNAITGPISTTAFDTENYSNVVNIQFLYKATKGYVNNDFGAHFKLYVDGTQKVDNFCNTSTSNTYTYPFTCQNGSKDYSVKLETNVNGTVNCSDSTTYTITITRPQCPSSIAVNHIPDQTLNAQSVTISGTVTDTGCGNAVNSNSCVQITVKAPNGTTTTSDWRNVTAGSYSWTYNFPSPKSKNDFGNYSVTAAYSGSNNDHTLNASSSSAVTFTLFDSFIVPSPPIGSTVCISGDDMHKYILDDADAQIYDFPTFSAEPSATINLNLGSFTLQGLAVIQNSVSYEPMFYVTQQGNSSIMVYNYSGELQEYLSSPVSNPYGLAFNSYGYLWVASHETGGAIALMDPNTGSTMHTIYPSLNMITGIAWDSNNSTILALADGMSNIYRLNPANGQIQEQLPLESNNCKAIAAFDGQIYVADYNTREFYLWGQKTGADSIPDFELQTDSGPNTINLSWTAPDLDPNRWNKIRIYHNGQLLDTVPYCVVFYSHTGLSPYSYHTYCLTAYDENEALEGCPTQTLGAYAGLAQQPEDGNCQGLKAAGMVLNADLSGDCMVNLYDFALFAAQWLIDPIAPASPTNLTATTGTGYVQLNWDENTEDDLKGYNVYRAKTDQPYLLIAQNVATNYYTDNTVTAGQTYYYAVTAVDTSNNQSEFSDAASASP